MTWFMIKEACELISTKVDRMIVYEHEVEGNDDNEHVHMYLVGTQVSTDTLKNYIRKFTNPGKGNGAWSFKTEYTPYGGTQALPVDSGCITYMSEGRLQPVFNKGFDQDEIIRLTNAYDPTIIENAKQKKQYQSKLMYVVKETHKESKLRQNQMVDEIIKRLKETDDYSERAILLMIREVVIIEQNTICGRYKIRDYYDTVRAKLLSKESWLNEMSAFCIRM